MKATVEIKLSEIERAMKRAEGVYGASNWQAKCIEIALVPKIYRKLLSLNARVDPKITRHAGKNPKSALPTDRWSEFAGYTLSLYGWAWNSVRDDYYSHSPENTWRGMVREFDRVTFIHNLRVIGELARRGEEYWPYLSEVRDAHIRVIDDRMGEVQK